MEKLSQRLKKARKYAGLTQGQLAEAVGIKQASISELETEKASTTAYGYQLAVACGVSPEWLIHGTGPMESAIDTGVGAGFMGVAEDRPSNYQGLTPVRPHGSVPLISWITAGELCDAEDPYPLGGAEEFIPCPEKHSACTYALRVDGPSMDDGTSKGYRDGEIIYVDPEIDARHNSDVIVRTPGGQATFKRLQETAEGRFLLALNKDWPNRIIPVPEGTVICGVVIGSYQPRSR